MGIRGPPILIQQQGKNFRVVRIDWDQGTAQGEDFRTKLIKKGMDCFDRFLH